MFIISLVLQCKKPITLRFDFEKSYSVRSQILVWNFQIEKTKFLILEFKTWIFSSGNPKFRISICIIPIHVTSSLPYVLNSHLQQWSTRDTIPGFFFLYIPPLCRSIIQNKYIIRRFLFYYLNRVGTSVFIVQLSGTLYCFIFVLLETSQIQISISISFNCFRFKTVWKTCRSTRNASVARKFDRPCSQCIVN